MHFLLGLTSKLTNHEFPSKNECQALQLPGQISDVSKKINYLDVNRLLTGENDVPPIKSTHRSWYLNQAILTSGMPNTDPITRKQLQLAILHGYSKVSTISEIQSEENGFQSSPLLPEDCRYHRNTRNELISSVDEAYANDFGVQDHEFHLIDSPHIGEVFARELPNPKFNLSIRNLEEFAELIDQFLHDALLNQFPEHRVLINITLFENLNPKDLRNTIETLENTLMCKIKELPEGLDKIHLADQFLSKLHLYAFIVHKGQHALLLPEFLIDCKPRFDAETNLLLSRSSVRNRHGCFDRHLDSMMMRNGYRMCPAQVKAAWLKVAELKTILKSSEITPASLAIKRPIPKVCPNYSFFIHEPVISKFRALSKGNEAIPYLKIMPEATVRLLEGFLVCSPEIDQIFAEKGLTDLLQTSYFRILNGMSEAVFKKNSFVAFNNQIELIHQEIQNILAILEPHGNFDLAQTITAKMTKGVDSIIPKELKVPKVHLKASGMHSFSSTLSAVESQKRKNDLNVAVLKGSYYYQSDETLKQAKTYSLSVLDGDKFAEEDLESAFEHSLRKPIDLYVTQFHHNIQSDRKTYRPENVLFQVKTMFKKNVFAEKFTVLIDTTIDIEKSSEIRQFLEDELIQKLITDGRLNVVFLRSAQKFDMLGMDNYYGGISATVNNDKSFQDFDKRMSTPDDQLTGLSYQGLTHLHKYAGPYLDLFRQEIMRNTQRLYKKIPANALFEQGVTKPMQISRIEDDKLFFLDIKFPDSPKTAEAFTNQFIKFTKEQKLPFALRASFGFANTTLTIINGKKFRLNPGLDNEKTIDLYAHFLQNVQNAIETTKRESFMTLENYDSLIASKLSKLQISVK